MEYLVNEEELQWQNHPSGDWGRGRRKILHSKEKNGSLATVLMVNIPKGGGNPVHVHEESDDILYILSGKAKMEIEGIGSLEMKKGSCIRIPKNTKHRIHDVTQDLILYDIFAPATI